MSIASQKCRFCQQCCLPTKNIDLNKKKNVDCQQKNVDCQPKNVDCLARGGGPLLVSSRCQTKRPPEVGDHFWCPQGVRRNGHPRWGTTFGVLKVSDEKVPEVSTNQFLTDFGTFFEKSPGSVNKSIFDRFRKFFRKKSPGSVDRSIC